jgi:4-amino-4-deoxy-L-arabinose transferase-like glycosyltransferase
VARDRVPTAWWLLVLLVAGAAYVVGLGGLHVPHIGDEAPYLEVTRVTAASGRWLPLRADDPFLVDTKPPLLFWLGIASTDGGRAWTLWRLRLPIVVVTFLTAAVVFAVTRRIAPGRDAPWVAGLCFLAFWSSFQYGRPFLTNLPETLFCFLAFLLPLALPARRDGTLVWVAAGACLALACLVKSFVLVVPVGLALAAWRLVERGGALGPFLRRDAPRILVTVLVALAGFSLWPLLSGDARGVFDRFVLGQNAAKMGGDGGWLAGLVSGPYPVWNVWLGPLRNAGLLALPVVALCVATWRRRRDLTPEARALWIYVLSFLVAYTLPSQRQANYVLPVMPALAVLLGAAWPSIATAWLRLSAAAVAGLAAGGLGFVVLASRSEAVSGIAWGPGGVAVVAATFLLAALVAAGAVPARPTLALLVLGAFLSFGLVMAPFERGRGRFAASDVQRLEGATVWVEGRFRSRWERHRFLLPGADVRGYYAWDAARREELLQSGEILTTSDRPGAAPGDVEVLASRLDLRTRLTGTEVREILVDRRVDALVLEERVVRRRGARR